MVVKIPEIHRPLKHRQPIFWSYLSWLSGAIHVVQGTMYFIVKMEGRTCNLRSSFAMFGAGRRWTPSQKVENKKPSNHGWHKVYANQKCMQVLTNVDLGEIRFKKKISPAHSHAKWDSLLMPHSCRCWIESPRFFRNDLSSSVANHGGSRNSWPQNLPITGWYACMFWTFCTIEKASKWQ